jgi:hypothetical protein
VRHMSCGFRSCLPTGMAPERRMSYGSGSCLPTREDSGAPCVLRLQILPPYREGTCVTTTCPTVPCRQWASNLKESLAGLPVSNTHAYISKAPGVRGIIGLKDVRAGSTVNACKTYRQVATVWLQCSVGPIDHSLDTATMQGDPIARRHAVD